MAEISHWLQNALVADLVEQAQQDHDFYEVHDLIYVPIKDEREVTGHLARHLGFRDLSVYNEAAGLHATLLALVPELERLLKARPLPEDGKDAEALAQLVCRDLSPVETYATLLAGPPRWRGRRVSAGVIDSLPAQLAPVLVREFAASLNDLFARWRTLNVPGLFRKWKADEDARQERERVAALEARTERTTDLSEAERAERRREREDRMKQRTGMGFTPTYRAR